MKPTLVAVDGRALSPEAEPPLELQLRHLPLTRLPEVIENDASGWLLWDHAVLWRDLLGNDRSQGWTA